MGEWIRGRGGEGILVQGARSGRVGGAIYRKAAPSIWRWRGVFMKFWRGLEGLRKKVGGNHGRWTQIFKKRRWILWMYLNVMNLHFHIKDPGSVNFLKKWIAILNQNVDNKHFTLDSEHDKCWPLAHFRKIPCAKSNFLLKIYSVRLFCKIIYFIKRFSEVFFPIILPPQLF